MSAVESRRRTHRSGPSDILTKTERAAVGIVLSDTQNKKRRPKKRKLQWWERHELSDVSLLLVCLGVGIVIYTVKYRATDAANYPSLQYTTKEFRTSYMASRSQIAPHKKLYHEVYNLAAKRLKPPDQTEWPEHERRPYDLTSFYGPSVQQCSLTVLVWEQNLGKPVYDFGPGQPLWFELESIASAIPDDACVALQTTTCSMNEYLGAESTEDTARAEIVKNIYDSSLPLFRRVIESGRVRISFLDYHNYNVKVCRNLENLSLLFLNVDYWNDEFVEADSDTVLIHQAGASFCYPLTDLNSLKDYALVGSLWPKDHHAIISDPLEGACRGMPTRWRNWLHPQRRWKLYQEKPELAAKQDSVVKPREFLTEDFPKICENGRGPIGHGTLSLRSRQWMIKAIQTCPHTIFSGLKVEDEPFACKVFDSVGHDIYFATILEGIGAPMPLACEASLFSTEMFWPDDVWLLYGYPDDQNGKTPRPPTRPERPIVRIDDEEFMVPNAVVQPWLFHSKGIVSSKQMENACPFMPFTVLPMENIDERDSTLSADKVEWVGVGH